MPPTYRHVQLESYLPQCQASVGVFNRRQTTVRIELDMGFLLDLM